jgi:hypothetical protein
MWSAFRIIQSSVLVNRFKRRLSLEFSLHSQGKAKHVKRKWTSNYIYEVSKSKIIQEFFVKIYFKTIDIPAWYLKLEYQVLKQHPYILYECVSWFLTLTKEYGLKIVGQYMVSLEKRL